MDTYDVISAFLRLFMCLYNEEITRCLGDMNLFPRVKNNILQTRWSRSRNIILTTRK